MNKYHNIGKAFAQVPNEYDSALAKLKQGAVVVGDECVLTGNSDLEDSSIWLPTAMPETPSYLPGTEHAAPLAADWRDR